MENKDQYNNAYLNSMEFIEKAYFKELDMIQSIINRMAKNSFLIKGWTITLIVVTMLIKAAPDRFWGMLLAIIPLLMFWILDGFFLNQEKLYRNLQKKIIADRLYTIPPQKDNKIRRWFNMNASTFTDETTGWFKSIFSKTLSLFYGGIFLLVVVYTFVEINYPNLG
jgi:hypothetical protein